MTKMKKTPSVTKDPKKKKKKKKNQPNSVGTASSRLILDELVVENVYTFFGVNTIPLTNTGLVVVTAQNHDTLNVSSNGTGKTRLWECLLRLFYGRKALRGEPPLLAFDKNRGNSRIECTFKVIRW